MDERMLKTGPVPVNTQLDRLPEAGKSECKLTLLFLFTGVWTHADVLD